MVDNEWEPKFNILRTSTKLFQANKLSDKHQLIMKEAYLHPYEKYTKQENAKRQLNVLLKKEIKQRQDHVTHQNFNMTTQSSDDLEAMLERSSLQFLRRQTSHRRRYSIGPNNGPNQTISGGALERRKSSRINLIYGQMSEILEKEEKEDEH